MSAVHAAFGARVRTLRTRRGWSRRELARRARLRTPATITRVEAGNGIYLDNALAIAGALGEPLERLAAVPCCPVCAGMPAAGLTCQECGTAGPGIEVPR